MDRIKVLFYTAAGGKFGMGHFMRCHALAKRGLNELEAFFYLKGMRKYADVESREMISLPDNSSYVSNLNEIKGIDLIVSDKRNSSIKEIKKLVRIAPVLSFDDWGAALKYAHITICALPTLYDINVNLSGLNYLILNPLVTSMKPLPIDKKEGVLVCFGGSDPYNLSIPVGKALNTIGIKPVVMLGPYTRIEEESFEGDFIRDFSLLPELINKSRVLITSFGITLFEAMYLQTPVILINNTVYHNKLAEKFSVVNLGYKNKRLLSMLPDLLGKTFINSDELEEKAIKNRDLVDGMGVDRVLKIMKNAVVGGRRDCLFNHCNFYSLKRTDKDTLFRCKKCGDLFNFRFSFDSENKYDSPGYFLSNYKSQYGRTYIADRKNIERMAESRLRKIEEMRGGVGRLLDVGSALGFFLNEAIKRGWEAEGVEVSNYAVEWSRRRLGVSVIKGSFIDMRIEPESYDAITFFYVLEHFKALEIVIEKAVVALRHGGVLAVAMPSVGGISFRLNRANYIKEHPDDHYIDTKPLNFKKYLKEYGFTRFNIISTGIHPERFSLFSWIIKPLKDKIGASRLPLFNYQNIKHTEPFYNIYCRLAEKLKLGDTFEIYAVKS